MIRWNLSRAFKKNASSLFALHGARGVEFRNDMQNRDGHVLENPA